MVDRIRYRWRSGCPTAPTVRSLGGFRMYTRFFVSAALLAAGLASPLAAQGAGGSMAGMKMDHTSNIKGSGKLPGGWMNRFDDKTAALTEVEVMQMGPGLHFRS